MPQAIATPPTVLTMDEYRRRWEPQGWQLLIIGPTATWRQEWGEWEAIRDIVQNCLDETEAYEFGWDSQGLWISDRGKGVAVADFLLGPPKPKPPWARGRFGEGMKIAALALLRRGYSVKVDTVGREVWLVFLKVKVDGEAEQLAALWRPDGRKHGTLFHIMGYFGPAYEDRFAVNIPRQHILHQAPSPLAEPVRRYNQLIGEPFQGRIYARDIYMRDINSPWSYNLWGFDMAPDRHGPRSDADVHTDMGRLWATVTDVGLLERLLGMVARPPAEHTYESEYLVLSTWLGREPVSGKRYLEFTADNAPAWQQAWRRRFGEAAVLRTDSRWDGTVRHLGYEPVEVAWDVREGLARAIKTDEALVKESQERLREVQVIPDDRLSPRQWAHLDLARAIVGMASFATPRRLTPEDVHAAIIPPASDRTRTAGMYARTTQEIYIGSDQLERARSAVDTVLHELAHHNSGAEDLTEEHSAEMTRLAARVVELTARGDLDGFLQEAEW
jgi:hypothetical protein